MFGRKGDGYYKTHMTDDEIESVLERKKSRSKNSILQSLDDLMEQSLDISTAR